MAELSDHELKPCPWCGAGTTEIVPNGRVWAGTKWGEPSSVSVRHWCEPVEGQPSRMLERVGRDEASAIDAWNRRALNAQPAAAGAEPMTSERHFALREAHAIGASDAYFKVWPTHDNDAGRMLFERGFVRGFDTHDRLVNPAAPVAPAEPGWQLVPVEPTGDMLVQGSTECGTGMLGSTVEAGNVWRAMLAAAPHPAEPAA